MNIKTELPWTVIIKLLSDVYYCIIALSLSFFQFIDFHVILSPFPFTITWVSCVVKASDFSLFTEPMGSCRTQGFQQVTMTDKTRRLLCSEQSPTFFSEKKAISFKKCREQKIYN